MIVKMFDRNAIDSRFMELIYYWYVVWNDYVHPICTVWNSACQVFDI